MPACPVSRPRANWLACTVFGKHHCKVLAAPALHLAFSLVRPPLVISLQGSIQLTLEFISIDKDPNWNQGVKGSGNNGAVPDVYFPMRKGCHVTLYNDAHVVSLLTLSVNPQQCRSSRDTCCSPAQGCCVPLDIDALCLSQWPASVAGIGLIVVVQRASLSSGTQQP